MMFIGFDPSPQLIKSTCGETSEREPSERPGDDIDIRMTNLGNQILNGIFQNVCRGHTTHSHALHPFLLFFCGSAWRSEMGSSPAKSWDWTPEIPKGLNPWAGRLVWGQQTDLQLPHRYCPATSCWGDQPHWMVFASQDGCGLETESNPSCHFLVLFTHSYSLSLKL